jgi:hypothetical protein
VRPRQAIGKALTRSVDLFNRNPWSAGLLQVVPRRALSFYAEDGLWTYHGHGFIASHRFQSAYGRAVKAAGFDYGIRWRVHTILWAAEHGRQLEGAFVECGTGRGFMASAICQYLGWKDRRFYLYDTFLPYACDQHGRQTPEGEILEHYARDRQQVARNFSEWSGVELVEGEIPKSLLADSPIAFLHVDLNNAAAEEAVIRHFWPKLQPTAPVVFDDYGFEGFEAQRTSADRLAQELGFQILALPTGQGLVLR